MARSFAFVVGVALALFGFGGAEPLARADDAVALRSLGSEPTVTLYGASWCSACKSLEKELRERSVPFTLVDVEQNPRAYDVARRATGKSVIPISSVEKSADEITWFVGADADGIEKSYRGN
jgi:mycoredoxin